MTDSVTLKGKEYFVERDIETGRPQLILPQKDISDINEIKGLEDLKELKTLDLSENCIKELKGLENLIKLEDLYLGSNKIKEIKGLETLTNLEKLRLGNNQIEELKGLENLSKLKRVYLNGNPLRNPDWSIALMKVMKIENQTHEWFIWNRGAKQVVNYCRAKKEGRISFVTVKGKKYYAYPIEIIHYFYEDGTIERADYENDDTPYRITEKEDPLICTLDLHDIGIIDINEIQGLDCITELEWLDLSGNNICDVRELGKFRNLKRLDLGNSEVTKITGLETLTNLKIIDLSRRKIRDITEIGGLEQLSGLQEIDLTDNLIEEIKGLGHLNNLKKLSLRGNPLREDEQHLIYKSAQEIVKHSYWVKDLVKDRNKD